MTIDEALEGFLPLPLGSWSSLINLMVVCHSYSIYTLYINVRCGAISCKLSEDIGSAGQHLWHRVGIRIIFVR